jgi:type IV pilus assembly protein PilO
MNKPYWHLLCVVMVVGIFAYFLDQSVTLSQQLSAVRQQTKTLKQQSRALFYQQVLLEEDDLHYLQLKKTVAEWQGKFIKTTDINKLLREIKKIGSASQLQFLTFQTGNFIKLDRYTKIPVKIAAIGTFDDTVNFINQMANLPWLVSIGDLTFTAIQPNSVVTSQIDLDLYSI